MHGKILVFCLLFIMNFSLIGEEMKVLFLNPGGDDDDIF